MSPIIEVEDVWHIYPPNITALKGVTLRIELGESIALIGQNGGGKTTLAKHFNGLLKPTRGKVLVKGVDTKTRDTGDLALTVGYVFQNPIHQIFSSTVYDEIAFGPKNIGMTGKELEERVMKTIEEVGLSGYEKTHPYDLDYGKMKLLTIASIMAMNPDVYCLDEPTTGQDHVGRRTVAALVKRLNAKGATVITITHDMRFVANVARRVILIADGRILADGPTRAIFQSENALRSAQIKPPQVTQLAEALSEYNIPKDILTVDEMALAIRSKL
mgnify:FL=1